jgi:hypothetical protein
MRVQLSLGMMVGLCCTAACVAAPAVPPVSAPADGEVAGWVDKKVAECSPKPEERRFDQTGWLTDIRSALELAKRHNRPVFLFTHDGRMGLGRC